MRQFERLVNRKNRRQIEFAAGTLLHSCWQANHASRLWGYRVPVSYSRDKITYISSRYKPALSSYTAMMKVMDLALKGRLMGRKGYYNRGTGFRSSFLVIEFIMQYLDLVDPVRDVKVLAKEAICLRDWNKQLVTYQDTEQTEKNRKLVTEINEAAVQDLSLDLPIEGSGRLLLGSYSFIDLLWQREKESAAIRAGMGGAGGAVLFNTQSHSANVEYSTPKTPPMITCYQDSLPRFVGSVGLPVTVTNDMVRVPLHLATAYHRSFTQASWTKGGRFYAPVQGVPSSLRRFLTIAGTPTAEVDYSAFHARMAYHIRGLDPQSDPYAIELGWGHPELERQAVKWAVNMLLNCRSDAEAAGALKKKLRRSKAHKNLPRQIMDVQAVIRLVHQKHSAIEHVFCKGLGVSLQYLDSLIAQEVLLNFTRQGKAIVGIHDSFVVAAEDASRLAEVMTSAYQNQLKVKFEPKFKAKH